MKQGGERDEKKWKPKYRKTPILTTSPILIRVYLSAFLSAQINEV
jgi:hypothetical protein